MKVRSEQEGIEKALENVCLRIEEINENYQKYYAEYGWDSFSETLANVAAQLYMMRQMIHNAEVIKDHCR